VWAATRPAQAETLHHLGDTHHIAGDQDQAAVAWQQALTIYDDLGHPAAASEVRAKLGTAPGSQGGAVIRPNPLSTSPS
jgi:predicted TPR repeat methyltransferase